MTDDARIARNVSTPEGRLAFLGELLAMMRDMEAVTDTARRATEGEISIPEVASVNGTLEEMGVAKQAAARTANALLRELSEQDLDVGLTKGYLSAEDHREALVAMREMSLSRRPAAERDRDHERD